jgi:hypothetical protein
MVEVFSEDSQPLAAHSRLTGVGKFSTFEAHYPEQKLSVARFEVHHAKAQAQKLGPQVQKLVDKLFATDHPLRHLRRVQGILRLAKRYPITLEALNHACAQALLFNKTRLSYIKDCALYFLSHGPRPTLLAPHRQADTIHLHQLSVETDKEEEIL